MTVIFRAVIDAAMHKPVEASNINAHCMDNIYL